MENENEIKMVIPSSLENLTLLRAFVKVYLEVLKVDLKVVNQLITIVDELSTNVVEHGYKYQKGDIHLTIAHEDHSITIIIEDDGVGYDESKLAKEEGGMGLLLARKLSDNFKIEKKIQGTIFKVEKKLRG